MPNYEVLNHFTASEFNEPDKMNQLLLALLDQMRGIAGIPIKITSSYREGDPLSHGDGDGVDLACGSSGERFSLVRAAIEAGFVRIGVYDQHIHVDVSSRLPQNVMWWGTSK